jgi:hypothetical protein
VALSTDELLVAALEHTTTIGFSTTFGHVATIGHSTTIGLSTAIELISGTCLLATLLSGAISEDSGEGVELAAKPTNASKDSKITAPKAEEGVNFSLG